MPIGERLREEREKLGYSQPKFASIAGTTKQTLFAWETNKTAPDAVQLSSFAGIGVDVQYIITGERSARATAEFSPVNLSLLREIIEGVEDALDVKCRKLPAKKKAELIGLIYEHFEKEGRAEGAVMQRYLQLVA